MRRDQNRASAIEVARLRHQILQLRLRRLEAERTNNGEHADEVMREVDPEIRRLTQELTRAESEMALRAGTEALRAMEAQAVDAARLASTSMQSLQPPGYLGVSYSGDPKWWYAKDRGLVVYHASDPVIVSIEPGSPAERGGLEVGDTIVAYNSQAVRGHEIALGRMLRPGERVVVRVRREGRARDVPVVVGRRPDGDAPFMMLPGANGGSMTVTVPSMPSMPSMPTMPAMPTMPSSPSMAAMAPVPPMVEAVAPPPAAWGVAGEGGTLLVAGARLDRLTTDWRDLLGVDSGVVVLGVAAGSPAHEAGLRAGDVIVRAGNRSVVSPASIQRELERASDRSVILQIVRRAKTRTVILRW